MSAPALPRAELAVVLPVYRNAPLLAELAARLTAALTPLTADFRLLFVVDASPDGSWEEVVRLAGGEPRIGGVLLERNVGQHRAVLAGLGLLRARHYVVMDADLQDPPEALPALLARARATGRTVFALRRGRYQGWGRMLTSRLFKGLLGLLTGLPAQAGTYFVVEAAVAAAMAAARLRSPQVVVMAARLSAGFETVPVARALRPAGRSAYGPLGRLRAARRALACARECRAGPRAGEGPPPPAVRERVNL